MYVKVGLRGRFLSGEENERIVESAVLCFHFIDKFCVAGYGDVYKQSINTCVVKRKFMGLENGNQRGVVDTVA